MRTNRNTPTEIPRTRSREERTSNIPWRNLRVHPLFDRIVFLKFMKIFPLRRARFMGVVI